jgi:hypothetical protein
MKRWCNDSKQMVDDPKVEKFIEELIKLYDKHGLAISHEDQQGSFIITTNKDPVYKKWIRGASLTNK